MCSCIIKNITTIFISVLSFIHAPYQIDKYISVCVWNIYCIKVISHMFSTSNFKPNCIYIAILIPRFNMIISIHILHIFKIHMCLMNQFLIVLYPLDQTLYILYEFFLPMHQMDHIVPNLHQLNQVSHVVIVSNHIQLNLKANCNCSIL